MQLKAKHRKTQSTQPSWNKWNGYVKYASIPIHNNHHPASLKTKGKWHYEKQLFCVASWISQAL